MPKLVDLKAKPYNLSDKQVAWVNETIAGMTDEEKVGQLFTNLFFFGNDAFSGNDFTNQEIVEKFRSIAMFIDYCVIIRYVDSMQFFFYIFYVL